MVESFNAKEEAKTVENLGYMLFHAKEPIDTSRLTDSLANLTPLQAEALNEQLKFDNWKPNTNPSVQMLRDESGHINGFGFTPSFFDSTAHGAYLMIGVKKGIEGSQD